MEEVKIQNDIYVARRNSFADNLKALAEQGAEPISLRDYAKRIYENPPERLSLVPIGFVRESVVYVPDKSILLVRDSPLVEIATAEKLVEQLRKSKKRADFHVKLAEVEGKDRDARRNIEEAWQVSPYFIKSADRYLQMAQEDSEKIPEERRVLDVTKYFANEDCLRVPQNELGEHEIFRWAFRDYLQKHITQSFPKESRPVSVSMGSHQYRDRTNHENVTQIRYSPAEKEFFATENERYVGFPAAVLGIKKGER